MLKKPNIHEPPRTLIGDDEQDSLDSFIQDIRSGKTGNNELVSHFENEFASALNVAHVISTNSATSGLQIILQAAGIKKGQEVIVTPYTFSATAHAIVNAGGIPVFADINQDTLCLDLDDVQRKISDNTFGIMAVHIGGKAENMHDLCALAQARGIHVFEDAAQAHGASYDRKFLGTFGTAGVYSFGTKLISSFRGGAIVTNDSLLAKKCHSYTYHGIFPEEGRSPYIHEYPGYNFQMSGLQAALLRPQIKKLPKRFEKRYRNGLYLKRKIEEVPGLKVASPSEKGTSNFYMFEILYDKSHFSNISREDIINLMQQEGLPILEANIIESPIYKNPSLCAYNKVPCPMAESVYNRLIILGHYLRSTLLEAEIETLDLVVEKIKRVKEIANSTSYNRV